MTTTTPSGESGPEQLDAALEGARKGLEKELKEIAERWHLSPREAEVVAVWLLVHLLDPSIRGGLLVETDSPPEAVSGGSIAEAMRSLRPHGDGETLTAALARLPQTAGGRLKEFLQTDPASAEADTWLQGIGLPAGWPVNQRRKLHEWVQDNLETRVGQAITRNANLSDEQLTEFERLYEADEDDLAFRWLLRHVPNYRDFVEQGAEELLRELEEAVQQLTGPDQGPTSEATDD